MELFESTRMRRVVSEMPSAMLPSILDAVRNEKTDIYYQIGKAFLFAKLKRAGQG